MIDQRVRFWKAIIGSGVIGLMMLFSLAIILDGTDKGGPGMMTMLGALGVFDAIMMAFARMKLKGLQKDD